MTVIEVNDLRRRYGDYEAVRGVSFAIGAGELFALLGTNGAGRTSTMELVEGLARPSGGRVRVLANDPYQARAAQRAALSPGTVRNYLSSASAKVGAVNRHEPARIARRYGWI